MSEPIFKIKKKKYTEESTVISVRIPKDMLADVDSMAKFSGHSRNEILQMGIEFALQHMQVESDK